MSARWNVRVEVSTDLFDPNLSITITATLTADSRADVLDAFASLGLSHPISHHFDNRMAVTAGDLVIRMPDGRDLEERRREFHAHLAREADAARRRDFYAQLLHEAVMEKIRRERSAYHHEPTVGLSPPSGVPRSW